MPRTTLGTAKVPDGSAEDQVDVNERASRTDDPFNDPFEGHQSPNTREDQQCAASSDADAPLLTPTMVPNGAADGQGGVNDVNERSVRWTEDPFEGHQSPNTGEDQQGAASSDTDALLKRIESLERSVSTKTPALAKDDAPIGAGVPLQPKEDGFDDNKKESQNFFSRFKFIDRLQSGRKSVWNLEEFDLPESTYTLLITEPIFSAGFLTGIIALGMSITCLTLVLIQELDNTSPDNIFGVPAGVETPVKIVQYLSIIIGVLMESEIPTGLEIMGKEIEQQQMGRRPFNRVRVFFSCILRLSVGYLFLLTLWMIVLQGDEVIKIFMDMLALEFVENIDDIIFELCKRGFLGRNLRYITNQTHSYEAPGNQLHRGSVVTQSSTESTNQPLTSSTIASFNLESFSIWCKRIIRFIFYMNMLVMLAGLAYVSVTQDTGEYRCKSISVAFGDDVWEGAWVIKEGEEPEDRLLIYSHFNGIYVEETLSLKENLASVEDRPMFTERNKEDGDRFQKTVPAEFMYCEDIEAWVFRHPQIRTKNTAVTGGETENECNWLLRSPRTDSFDLIEVAEAGGWEVWKGVKDVDYTISITCNDCGDDADCNYNGKCVDQKCECYDELDFFGVYCELQKPCGEIRSEKDPNTTLKLAADPYDDTSEFVEVYNRPLYYAHMSGIPFGLMRGADEDLAKYADMLGRRSLNNLVFDDDDFFDIHLREEAFLNLMKNYTFVLGFTGRRWYGQIKPWTPIEETGNDKFKEEEYHAFWAKTFTGLEKDDNATLIISEPTLEASPVGLDFFELRRRNKQVFGGGKYDYDYGPFGVLIPMIDYDGAGFFHCNRDDE